MKGKSERKKEYREGVVVFWHFQAGKNGTSSGYKIIVDFMNKISMGLVFVCKFNTKRQHNKIKIVLGTTMHIAHHKRHNVEEQTKCKGSW